MKIIRFKTKEAAMLFSEKECTFLKRQKGTKYMWGWQKDETGWYLDLANTMPTHTDNYIIEELEIKEVEDEVLL